MVLRVPCAHSIVRLNSTPHWRYGLRCCYLSSANLAKGTAIWSYLCADSGGYNRLPRIAAAAKAAGKIQRVTLLFSCEPTFGYAYYQGAPWTAPRDLFLQQWASKATADMKQWLVVGDVTTFVSKYAR
ncbi:MAG: hypothetical protein EBW14_04515, partial [Oxalobacteraceae bacterium]|nr:hypothetical protein [Oxalobacteraceae bacterium]